jgi:hypothetical protein
VSFYPGDLVRLNEPSSAFVSKDPEASRSSGIVIKSRKREVHREKGTLGLMTEIAVVDIVEIMWSDGTVQSMDGRYLEKITTRTTRQEAIDDG